MKKSPYFQKTLGWLQHIANTPFLPQELLGVAIVISAFFVELKHIMSTAGSLAALFFSNSDMLTLALTEQSTARGEPFHWVFSSQIFLFPESILYWISSLLTPNFRLAILLNALLNLLLLYAAFRFVIGAFAMGRISRIIYAALATSAFTLLAFLESMSTPFVATYYLLTTAYYGVILVALFILGISLRLTQIKLSPFNIKSRAILLPAIALFLIAFLTNLSNPLFIMWVLSPLFVVFALGLLIHLVPWRTACLVLIPLAFGTALSMTVRKLFFSQYFSERGGISNYLHFSSMGTAAETLINTVVIMYKASWQSRLEIVIIIAILMTAIAAFLFVIYKATNPSRQLRKLTAKQRTAESTSMFNMFIMSGTVSLIPLGVVVACVITGNATLRYLVPLTIFPFLAAIPLLPFLPCKELVIHLPKSKILIGVAFIAILVALFTKPVTNIRAAADFYTPDQQCIDANMQRTPNSVGIAQFWRARGLQLNSHTDLTIMQSGRLISRFTWLYNNATYDTNQHPSFVIADKIPDPTFEPNVGYSDAFTIEPQNVVTLLGQPTAIYECPSFYIYTYSQSNPGAKILHDRMQSPRIWLW